MQISRAGDYALRAVVFLSRQDSDRLCTIGEIAHAQQIPRAFLAKLMPMLIKGNVVKSVQGPKGGYRLARSADKVNFLEVIQAIEGPIRLVHCQEDGSCCEIEEYCSLNEVFAMAQKQLLDFFRSATFADLPILKDERFLGDNLIKNLSREKSKTGRI